MVKETREASFISALVPSHKWIDTYCVAPYLQSAERLRWAIYQGSPHLYFPEPISLKERTIYCLQGILLCIPLLNTIAWIFMQHFSSHKHF